MTWKKKVKKRNPDKGGGERKLNWDKTNGSKKGREQEGKGNYLNSRVL